MSKADDALAAAEEAEAEAAEAEAMAKAARARARAIRLRREAAAEESTPADEPTAVEESAAGDEPASVVEVPTETTVEEEAPVESSAVELDEPTAVDESEAEPDDPAEGKRRRRPSAALLTKIVAVALAIVGVLVLLALSAAMNLQHKNLEAQQQQSAEFAAAARQGVVTLMSLDFTKAKDDVQRIIDNTTGDFKKDFEGQADDFVKVAQESKVVTEANVNAVAVQSMTKDTATVLVAVVTNVSNAASAKQDPRSWRLSVDVARDGGQIKLAKVEFVP